MKLSLSKLFIVACSWSLDSTHFDQMLEFTLGSTVSPVFFNIYPDSFLDYNSTQLNISVEDILKYADEIIILVYTYEDLSVSSTPSLPLSTHTPTSRKAV